MVVNKKEIFNKLSTYTLKDVKGAVGFFLSIKVAQKAKCKKV